MWFRFFRALCPWGSPGEQRAAPWSPGGGCCLEPVGLAAVSRCSGLLFLLTFTLLLDAPAIELICLSLFCQLLLRALQGLVAECMYVHIRNFFLRAWPSVSEHSLLSSVIASASRLCRGRRERAPVARWAHPPSPPARRLRPWSLADGRRVCAHAPGSVPPASVAEWSM